MTFLEHMEKIDNIIAEKRENEKKNALFAMDAQTASGGMGFSSTYISNINTYGSTTHMDVMSQGQLSHVTMMDMPGGMHITEF